MTGSARAVYFVGAPWKGHAEHSGYEVFCDRVGKKLWRFPLRALPGFVGKVVDRAVGRLVGRKYYTLGNLLTELYALAHLLFHPSAHYHVLYGDSDTVLLAAFLRHWPHSASTTVHLPADRLPAEFSYESLRGFETIVFLAEVHRAIVEPLIPWARCAVVPHPVDTEFFRPSPDPCHGSRRVLLSVGGHLRDFATLAGATRALVAANIVDELVVVGMPQSEEHRLDALVAAGRATVCGHVDDGALRALYNRASVVVLALEDAFANNALLEALACGCPIVASDVGAVGEYLGDGGLQCPPHDAEALASAVAGVIGRPGEAERLRRAARARSAQFACDAVAARFVAATGTSAAPSPSGLMRGQRA